jgi:uncharacterized protein YhfF/L-amino acid N-acyltransferase YncA
METGRRAGDTGEVADVVADLRARSGLDVVGALAFGDSPALQDELLAFVRLGTKRATAGAAHPGGDEPRPTVGQLWGLLDGSGTPHYVMRTVEVTYGPLASVTPAFAWDEGEYDRTVESWLDGHRGFFHRMGAAEPDALDVCFERFEIVWPQPDQPVWLTRDVRELRFDERAAFRDAYTQRWGTTTMVTRGHVHDVGALPGLVCERNGTIAGVATFRPRPDGQAECVSFDAFERGAGVGAALTAGLVELAQRHGWRRLWLITTNDNTPALRAYQRHGWELVALHRGAVEQARARKPEIPDTGLDGIPLHSELELEIRLP